MPTAKAKTTKAAATTAARKMTRREPSADTTPVLGDHPDTFGIIHRAVAKGARDAIAENDRLGIASPGAKDDKIVYRKPPRSKTTSKPGVT
jgi:hypothetical protein